MSIAAFNRPPAGDCPICGSKMYFKQTPILLEYCGEQYDVWASIKYCDDCGIQLMVPGEATIAMHASRYMVEPQIRKAEAAAQRAAEMPKKAEHAFQPKETPATQMPAKKPLAQAIGTVMGSRKKQEEQQERKPDRMIQKAATQTEQKNNCPELSPQKTIKKQTEARGEQRDSRKPNAMKPQKAQHGQPDKKPLQPQLQKQQPASSKQAQAKSSGLSGHIGERARMGFTKPGELPITAGRFGLSDLDITSSAAKNLANFLDMTEARETPEAEFVQAAEKTTISEQNVDAMIFETEMDQTPVFGQKNKKNGNASRPAQKQEAGKEEKQPNKRQEKNHQPQQAVIKKQDNRTAPRVQEQPGRDSHQITAKSQEQRDKPAQNKQNVVQTNPVNQRNTGQNADNRKESRPGTAGDSNENQIQEVQGPVAPKTMQTAKDILKAEQPKTQNANISNQTELQARESQQPVQVLQKPAQEEMPKHQEPEQTIPTTAQTVNDAMAAKPENNQVVPAKTGPDQQKEQSKMESAQADTKQAKMNVVQTPSQETSTKSNSDKKETFSTAVTAAQAFEQKTAAQSVTPSAPRATSDPEPTKGATPQNTVAQQVEKTPHEPKPVQETQVKTSEPGMDFLQLKKNMAKHLPKWVVARIPFLADAINEPVTVPLSVEKDFMKKCEAPHRKEIIGNLLYDTDTSEMFLKKPGSYGFDRPCMHYNYRSPNGHFFRCSVRYDRKDKEGHVEIRPMDTEMEVKPLLRNYPELYKKFFENDLQDA